MPNLAACDIDKLPDIADFSKEASGGEKEARRSNVLSPEEMMNIVNNNGMLNEAFMKLPIYVDSAQKLEVCSRAYLQSYMRASRGAAYLERDCIHGENCICNSLSVPFPLHGQPSHGASGGRGAAGFICREFLLPSQDAKAKNHQGLPTEIGMCVLCNRFTTMHQRESYTQQRPGVQRKVSVGSVAEPQCDRRPRGRV